MPTKRMPLYGSYRTRHEFSGANLNVIEEQFFKNCFPESVENPLSGQVSVTTLKRLGFSATADSASGNLAVHAGCIWTGSATIPLPAVLAFTNSGATEVLFYQWSGTTLTSVGSAITATNCQSLTETTISGVSNLVAVLTTSAVPAGQEIYFFPVGGAWTQVTDTDAPHKQTPALVISGAPVHKDGYMFVMCTNGQIWNSDLNSLANWTAANYITADVEPDLGVGLAASGPYILAFGGRTIEYYVNAGNPVFSPLKRVPQLTKNIGCGFAAKQDSLGSITTPTGFLGRYIFSIRNEVYFIGLDNKSGNSGIYLIKNTEITRISTAGVEAKMYPHATAILGVMPLFGMRHLVVATGTTTVTHLMYCIETHFWWEWTSTAVTNMAACVGVQGIALITDIASAKVFILGNPAGYKRQDNGATLTMTLQTGAYDFLTSRRKTINSVALVGEVTHVHAITMDGTADYASCPDASDLDITGDIDLRILCAADDWTPATAAGLVAKWVTTGNQRSYYLGLNTDGTLSFNYSTNGTNETARNSTAAVATAAGLADGDWVWARCTVDADNGASGHTVTFYWSKNGSDWTQLGDTVTTAGTIAINAGTGICSVGCLGAGASNFFDGKVYAAKVYGGIGGTLVADFNASFLSLDQTSYTDTNSNTHLWTLTSCVPTVSDAGISGDQLGLVASLACSDNDFITFETVGDFDLTQKQPRICGLGSHEAGRSYQLAHAIPRAFKCEALDLDYTVST